jgi:hypothetical protein
MSLKDRPPFPEVWDNTMVATGADCGALLNYKFFHNLRPNTNNIDLHAGGSFAKGLEVARVRFYTKDQIAPPSPDAYRAYGARALIEAYGDVDSGDNVKSADRMLGALGSYFEQYNPATDHVKPAVLGGKPAVEFTFSWPIDVVHPVTGNPLIYCGRFDMLGHLNNDETTMYVVDEKTTKQLGGSWAAQWGIRSQFMGYVWGARKYDLPVKGAIVRGISILKTKYGHAEAVVTFPPFLLDRWYEQLKVRLERWKRMWAGVEPWDYNFSSVCAQYGGCKFRLLCEVEDPDQWIVPNYRVEKWNPLGPRESEE